MAKDIPDLPGKAGAGLTRRRQSGPIDLNGMPLDELLDLRARIEILLPAKSLQDMDLQRELVLQTLALQTLQQKVFEDEDIPANQRAQVANSLSSALANLVKVQNEVYTSERLKEIEQALETTINEMEPAAREAFMVSYEASLGLS